MAASKQVGGDGAFIDPDDLERAATAMKAANVGVKAAERFSRRRARKQLPFRRRLRAAAKDGLVLGYFVFAGMVTIVWLGWSTRALVWLLNESIGELWRIGWNGWPF